MRKLLLSCMILFWGIVSLFAQQKVLMNDLTINGVFVKNYHSVLAKHPFKLTSVTQNSKGKSGKQIYLSLEVENSEFTVILSLDDMYHIQLIPHDVDSYWKAQFLRYGMVKHFEKKRI